MKYLHNDVFILIIFFLLFRIIFSIFTILHVRKFLKMYNEIIFYYLTIKEFFDWKLDEDAYLKLPDGKFFSFHIASFLEVCLQFEEFVSIVLLEYDKISYLENDILFTYHNNLLNMLSEIRILKLASTNE